MAQRKQKTVYYRRKRQGKTDYRKRLRMLISRKPRLVVRRTSSRIITQIIDYTPKGDKVLAMADSTELAKFGWNQNNKNIPAAYLTGCLLAKRANDAGIKEAIFDIGLHNPIAGTRIYAVLKAAADSGLNVPCSEEVFPKEDRIRGKHIASNPNAGPAAKDIEKAFDDTRSKIGAQSSKKGDKK